MSEKCATIIIGNGLGMAIDPTHFLIQTGIEKAWNEVNFKTQERIKKLVTNHADLNTESQLKNHYHVIQACLMLSKIENHSNLSWLDPEARSFPENFRDFVVNVALHYFNYEPEDYAALNKILEKLKKYIQNNKKTHLVTINYDKLIYDRFSTDSEIMSSTAGKLVDGFLVHKGGYTPSILWEVKDDTGFYLHLHGSPLFYTDNSSGVIDKSKFDEFKSDVSNEAFYQEHLILCPTNFKPILISQSPLLRSYWDFFKKALKESNKIILFGYSGNDLHVNEEISSVRYNKEIIIVEFENNQFSLEQRKTFWSEQLHLEQKYFNDNNLIRLRSILEYEFQ